MKAAIACGVALAVKFRSKVQDPLRKKAAQLVGKPSAMTSRVLLLLSLAGCAVDPNRTELHLEVVSGADQEGIVFFRLAVPLEVRLVRAGAPVSGASVSFDVASGSGSVEQTVATTNAEGRASAGWWKLGPNVGAQSVLVTTLNAEPLSIGATARMPPPRWTGGPDPGDYMSTMVLEAGDQQIVAAGELVPTPPAVRVRNLLYQPVPHRAVHFEVATGGGSLTLADATTDRADGIARVGSWRLGATPGVQTVVASSAGLPSLTFRVTALAPGPPTLTRTVLLSGLASPSDLAFAPDGTLIFSELGGDLRVLRPGATSATLLHRPADVSASGQSGLMGVAVDPDFARTRHIFVYFSSRVNPTTVDNRIVRFLVNPDWTGVADRQDLLVGISWGNGGAHSGGRLRFGPDGLLYLATGDTRSASVPQDPNALGAKVLRVRKDGTIPPGNPGPPLHPAIVAYGFRNPQGMAFRGGLFTCEDGPGTDDEVTRVVWGGNAGWDPKNPANPNDGAYWGDMGTSMTDMTKFPMAMRPAFRDANSSGMSGCDFLLGGQWRDWNGALAVASLGGRNVRILQLSEDGLSTVGTPQTIFGGMERLRAVVQGPDGALYLATDGRAGGDQIWRVTPQ